METMKDRAHSAKYLILVGPRAARRALLFNHEHRYLSEVIDDEDGLMVDALLRSGKGCELPRTLRLDGIVPAAQLAACSVQCIELGKADATQPALESAVASHG
jgi:hypothetical protein